MPTPSTVPRKPRLVKVELVAPLLNILFVSLFLYLILSNQVYWDLFNDTLSNASGFRMDWMLLINGLLVGIAVANVMIFVTGTIRIELVHRSAVILLLPAITLSIMLAMLVAIINVVERVNLDYIFFMLGNAALPVYLGVTAATFIIVTWIVFSCIRLWTYPAIDDQRKGERSIRPRVTAIATLISAGIAAGVLWSICFKYASTDLFWRSLEIVYSRFLPWAGAGMLGWFSVVATTIAVQVPRVKEMIPAGRGYVALLAGLVAAQVGLAIVAAMEFPLAYDNLWATMLPLLVPGTVLSLLPSITRTYRARLAPRVERLRHHGLVKIAAITGIMLVPYAFVFYLPLTLSIPSVVMPFTERMVSLDGVNVPFQGDLVFPSFEAQPVNGSGGTRHDLLLDGEWKWWWSGQSTDTSMYPRTPAIIAALSDGQHLPGFDDSTWETITVPRANCFPYWEGEQDDPRYGVFWYRKVVAVPATFAGHQLVLKFYGGGHVLDAWVNGEHVGYHEVTQFGFSFDVTALVIPNKTNTFAIRVDDPSWSHSRDPRHVWHSRHLSPSIDFFKYGGLVREIHLEALPAASIARVDVKAVEITTTNHVSGNVTARVDVVLRAPLAGSLAGTTVAVDLAIYPLEFPDEASIGSRATWTLANRTAPVMAPVRQQVTLAGRNGTSYLATRVAIDLVNVSLWTTKQPALHAVAVNVSVLATNQTIDSFWTQTGFRTLETSGTSILLNGADLKLAGVALHEETWDPRGSALTDDDIMHKLRLVANLSVNFVRLGAYPVHPNWYLFAERMGIASWCEAPLCWANEIHFTQLFARKAIEPVWIQTIFPSINRPGVLFWGGPNEPWAASDCIRFLQASKAFLDDVDGTRFFGYAAVSSHTWHGGFRDAGLPVVTPNNYGGTFDGVKYAFYEESIKSITAWQSNNPGKPFVTMEFGYWREGLWNGSAWVSDFANQAKCLNETYHALVDRGAAGMTWWIAFDYFGATDDGWYSNGMGMYSLDGTTEYPTAALMRVLYASFTAANT